VRARSLMVRAVIIGCRTPAWQTRMRHQRRQLILEERIFGFDVALGKAALVDAFLRVLSIACIMSTVSPARMMSLRLVSKLRLSEAIIIGVSEAILSFTTVPVF
jgi:hypothetical protein